ncbi:hypothetical protein Pla175_51890 [Pirellulimonas nuda]|uniref:Uncharacterized protein n=1 Tax=Pirellulimonas nuda TaxID=2528009 RepID=A0A518DJV7_9BACT|nr:Minf_1886 family protein [Pirellulimonas nuda]QDU91758.1 hypothetical protein Pla175_51890 [Pirellulimonas nuda]
MLEPINPLAELLRRDRRYRADAYFFVFDALRFAQDHLGMGQEAASIPLDDAPDAEAGQSEADDDDFDDAFADEEFDEHDDEDDEDDDDDLMAELDGVLNDEDDDDEHDGSPTGKHVSGQQLCEAIRRYALDQYGLLAKHVLGQWGVRKTDDFGEIVFNLIDIGKMRRTKDDTREDFVDVFDFEEGLVNQFRFRAPEVEATRDDR